MLYKSDSSAWFFFQFLLGLQFCQCLINEFQLHPRIVINIVVIGEHFFYVVFQLFHLLFQLSYSVYLWGCCNQLSHGNKSTPPRHASGAGQPRQR